MAAGIVGASELGIGTGREEHVPVAGSAIHPDSRHTRRVTAPLGILVQTPPDVGDRKGLRIAEARHVVTDELGVETTLDAHDSPFADRELDWIPDVRLEGIDDVTLIHDHPPVHAGVVATR